MNVPELSVAEARRRLEGGGWTYLDVRTEAEFQAGHAPGAINIPVAIDNSATGTREINPRFREAAERLLPKDRRIICGCKSGGRSAHATRFLLQAGYGDVVNMDGGFHGRPGVPGWATLGYPVTTEPTP